MDNEYLPYGGFKWLKNVDNFDVNSVSENSPIGYIVKLDLEYPDELDVLHTDYPSAQEKFVVSYDMLSDYCKKIADEYGIKVCHVIKLIPNLCGKTKCVLYYRNLLFYLSLRMKLNKIHSLAGWRNMSILTQKKKQLPLTVWKRFF